MHHPENDVTMIDVYRLMTLLNELYRAGQKELLIFMPYLKDPLFSIQLVPVGVQPTGRPENPSGQRSQVSLLVQFRAYQRFLDSLKSGKIAREIPNYGTLQALLLQSGIVEYPNFAEFLALLERMCQRDFHRGERPVFMGLDTNLFRDLFYSSHYQVLEHIPQNKIGFSVSPNVKDELTFDKKKYRNRDLEALCEFCVERQFRIVVKDFFNQSGLHDRLRRLGWVELEKIKRIHWIELLPELDTLELEGSGDLNIIKTYKLAAAERNVDILLLSRDDGFIGHAQGIPGIITFQIQNPVFRGRKYTVPGWRNICQLIYLSSVVCGAIRLQAAKDAYLVQGIWKGKKSGDWDRERMQIMPLIEKSNALKHSQRAWRVLDTEGWEVFG